MGDISINEIRKAIFSKRSLKKAWDEFAPFWHDLAKDFYPPDD